MSKFIFQQLSQSQNDNFLVSPFSAETILALTLSGSKGETANELRKALHLPKNKNRVENDIKTLLPQFKSNNFYTLESANKVYLKKNFHPPNPLTFSQTRFKQQNP